MQTVLATFYYRTMAGYSTAPLNCGHDQREHIALRGVSVADAITEHGPMSASDARISMNSGHDPGQDLATLRGDAIIEIRDDDQSSQPSHQVQPSNLESQTSKSCFNELDPVNEGLEKTTRPSRFRLVRNWFRSEPEPKQILEVSGRTGEMYGSQVQL